MIQLSIKKGQVVNSCDDKPIIAKVTDNFEIPLRLRNEYVYISKYKESLPEGFRAYLIFHNLVDEKDNANNIFVVPDDLSHISNGDIVRLNPHNGGVRILYRRNSNHNAILVTERCDNFCLMCSQPPRDIDDGYLVNEILEAIPKIDRYAKEICLTGGEPTLVGDGFYEIVKMSKNHLPETSLHILTNGRSFSDNNKAIKLAEIHHHDIMLGIPVYSDSESIHDFVVQARGAYNETIKGILNLKANAVPVEIRIVVHKQTYDRLPKIAEFITRNLTFVDHVAIMGLEMMGFARSNLDELWIDPMFYQNELFEAVDLLAQFHIPTSIYNHQLCILDERLHRYSVQSISDWKNEYMQECAGCLKKHECGGFFSSSHLRYSDHIRPFLS